MPKIDYNQLVPIPAPGDINSKYHAVSQTTMLKILGRPGDLTTDCSPVTNLKLKRRMITKTLPGGLRVTGLDVAVRSLSAIFDELMVAHPDLVPLIGSAGMLCCRAVRGSSITYSNHSWGCGIDLTINKVLTPQRASSCPQGLLTLYDHFHDHGWFWGAEFPVSDAMHFELAYETVCSLLA